MNPNRPTWQRKQMRQCSPRSQTHSRRHDADPTHLTCSPTMTPRTSGPSQLKQALALTLSCHKGRLPHAQQAAFDSPHSAAIRCASAQMMQHSSNHPDAAPDECCSQAAQELRMQRMVSASDKSTCNGVVVPNAISPPQRSRSAPASRT